jgi:hypothetical protein
MIRREDDTHDGAEPNFNPYAPPRAPLEPVGRFSPDVQGSISITHHLTDDELRHFVECDVFFDPMPLFGFIPQWIWLILITLSLGILFGMIQLHSLLAAVLLAPVTSLIMFAVLILMCKARRDSARVAGFCDNRTLTITPDGLGLTIPGAVRTPGVPVTVGEAQHPWRDFRKIELTERDMIFWLKGRSRLVLPRRVFSNPAAADDFLHAAMRWHAAAS